MWFLPLGTPLPRDWLLAFVEKLLVNDPATLRLLRHNPFPAKPPTHVRARLYHYRFTTWAERKETGAWWVRTHVGEYLPPLRLAGAA